MIGTEKQIAFAKDCIAAARAHFSKVLPREGLPSIKIDRSGAQSAALDVIELIESGDLAAAEEKLQAAAGWVTLCITEADGAPAIDAGAVIEALKKYIYL